MLAEAGFYVGPRPVIHPENAEFWTSLAVGELKLQRCNVCARVRFPIAPVCYQCGSLQHTWETTSADGVVAVAIEVHRATGDPAWASQVPFISGLIDVAPGLRLPGRIFCTCGDALTRGTPVIGGFQRAEGFGVLCFAHECAA